MRQQVSANARRLKFNRKDDRLEKDDVLEGLTAVVTVRLAEPQFEGQTKEVLGTTAVRGIVSRVVDTRADRAAHLDQAGREGAGGPAARQGRRRDAHPGRRPAAQGDAAAQERARDLVAARQARRLPQRRRGPLASCSSSRATPRSAPPSWPATSEFQALLPIRGKILNVQKASVSDMLKNAECASIIQVVGAGSGRTFDLDAARYGKIVLMTDADVDGAHIRTLLLTLFFRYMRPLVDAGRVYAAVPPLHRIEVINPGGEEERGTSTRTPRPSCTGCSPS